MNNPSKRLARWVDEFQQWNIVIKYRSGKLNTVPDALSRRPDYQDYLNAITLKREEDYLPYIERYLMKNKLPDEQEIRNKVIEEAENFVLMPGDRGNSVLHRKVGQGIIAPYVEYVFRGNLMERIHNQYGHLTFQSLGNIMETRAWWPSMKRDLKTFVAACPNCQVHQRQRQGQEREYAQLVSDQYIQPFQRWGIDLIGILPKTKNGNRWIITAVVYTTG